MAKYIATYIPLLKKSHSWNNVLGIQILFSRYPPLKTWENRCFSINFFLSLTRNLNFPCQNWKLKSSDEGDNHHQLLPIGVPEPPNRKALNGSHWDPPRGTLPYELNADRLFLFLVCLFLFFWANERGRFFFYINFFCRCFSFIYFFLLIFFLYINDDDNW